MKNILFVIFAIIALTLTGCNLDEEKVVTIRIHGYVRDKVTNNPLPGADVYINNGYIDEAEEYASSTDMNGYYEFSRDVWSNYATKVRVIYDVAYKVQWIEIDTNNDNELNFFLELY